MVRDIPAEEAEGVWLLDPWPLSDVTESPDLVRFAEGSCRPAKAAALSLPSPGFALCEKLQEEMS